MGSNYLLTQYAVLINGSPKFRVSIILVSLNSVLPRPFQTFPPPGKEHVTQANCLFYSNHGQIQTPESEEPSQGLPLDTLSHIR